MVTCPYCNESMNRVPKRRTACPSCHSPILVRKGRLYVEDEARALDWCLKLGIDGSDLYLTQKNLSAKFGKSARYTEAVWRLMQGVLERSTNWHDKSMIYFSMSRFLWEEKRDYLHLGRERIRAKLEEYRESEKRGLLDLNEWRIEVIGGGSCPACSALDGRRFTFEEFAETMPLPVAECTHNKTAYNPRGWCRCDLGLTRARVENYP